MRRARKSFWLTAVAILLLGVSTVAFNALAQPIVAPSNFSWDDGPGYCVMGNDGCLDHSI